jgi:membrane protein implicated in regulation of membrane protease activity
MGWLVDFYAAQPFWVWAGLGAGLLAIEVVTGSGWLLWAATSAAVTGVIVAFLGPSVPWAIFIFAALTLVSGLLGERLLPRRGLGYAEDINDNVGRLVGRKGSAVQAFRKRAGRVFIDGKEWAAELEEGDTLEAGASVQVTGVNGALLTVRRA